MSTALPLSRQRCFNHELREAAARCPECTHYYCRECVTEHEGRVLCVACLDKLLAPETEHRTRRGRLILTAQAIASLVILWLLFQTLGQGLAALPDSFHENGVWQADESGE